MNVAAYRDITLRNPVIIVADRQRTPSTGRRLIVLEPNQSVLFRWDELSNYRDGFNTVRNVALYWGRKLGRRYSCNKSVEGIWVEYKS